MSERDEALIQVAEAIETLAEEVRKLGTCLELVDASKPETIDTFAAIALENMLARYHVGMSEPDVARQAWRMARLMMALRYGAEQQLPCAAEPKGRPFGAGPLPAVPECCRGCKQVRHDPNLGDRGLFYCNFVGDPAGPVKVTP